MQNSNNFQDLNNGVVIKMMQIIGRLENNYLVVTEKISEQNRRHNINNRVKPVIWVTKGKWNETPKQIIKEYQIHGYWLVCIPRNENRAVIIDGNTIPNEDKMFHVLYCVRNEFPSLKFKGKVGPITSFVPRVDANGLKICGNYVGYHWNGNESLEEIPKHFDGKLTLKGWKAITNAKFDPNITVRRLGVIVGKDGCCVGMEVRYTKEEERVLREIARREKSEYHHTRPLLLENGFYVFDGVFTWQPIHCHLAKPIAFPFRLLKSPLVFLSEGIHLITTTKDEENMPNGETYSRRIEICPSLESEHVSIIDWRVFERDFMR